MSSAYLLLGSNLGNKEENLRNALELLGKCGNIRNISAIYETEPWGFSDKRNFFNMAICLETSYSPNELINEILRIEISTGRKRTNKKWDAREIDIDIIFFDNLVLNKENLIIPHPHLQERRFVLTPLNEIASDFIHPIINKSISHLLEECPDECDVEYHHELLFESIRHN